MAKNPKNQNGDTDNPNIGGGDNNSLDPKQDGGTEPTEPGAGTEPSGPGAGTEPTEPGAGTEPSEPGAGTEPSEPGAGTKPSEPGAGTKPSEPGAGTEPSEPGITQLQIPGTESLAAGPGAEPGAEPEKRKRGRPLGATKQKPGFKEDKTVRDKVLPETPPTEPQGPQNPQNTQGPKPTIAPINISGEMAIEAIDLIGPALVKFGGGFIEPKIKKIPTAALKFTDDEKKHLAPVAKAVVDEYIKLTPVQYLLGYIAVAYTARVAVILDAMNESERKKQK